LRNKITAVVTNCNCIKKIACPLNNQCLSKNVVYKATISSDNPILKEKSYIGISENTFKLRFANHLKSFNATRYKNDTELSKEIWRLKDAGTIPIIKWNIIKRCQSYNPSTERCNLCLNEKFLIMTFDNGFLLNKKSELVSSCRHRKKFLLSQFDTGD
jgi:hypothetical protein